MQMVQGVAAFRPIRACSFVIYSVMVKGVWTDDEGDIYCPAREQTDRNRFYMMIKVLLQAFRRPLFRFTCTTLTVSVTLLMLCHLAESLEVKEMMESIAARGSRLRGELLFVLPGRLWERNGGFVIRAEHNADINASFLSSKTIKWRYLFNPYRQRYKETCPTGQESGIKAHSWLSRREDIDGGSCSVSGSHTLEDGTSNVSWQNFGPQNVLFLNFFFF